MLSSTIKRVQVLLLAEMGAFFVLVGIFFGFLGFLLFMDKGLLVLSNVTQYLTNS